MTLDQYLSQDGRSVKSMAAALGVASPMVSQWRTGARQVPAERCPDIERTTGGDVRCEDMRPDVNWNVLRQTTAVGSEKAPNSNNPVAA